MRLILSVIQEHVESQPWRGHRIFTEASNTGRSQAFAKPRKVEVRFCLCLCVCVCRSFCLQPAACRLFTEIRLPGFMFMTMVRRSLFRRVEPPCEAESFSLCLFILQAIPLAQIPAPICEITVDGCEEGLEYEVGDSISSEYQAQCF